MKAVNIEYFEYVKEEIMTMNSSGFCDMVCEREASECVGGSCVIVEIVLHKRLRHLRCLISCGYFYEDELF